MDLQNEINKFHKKYRQENNFLFLPEAINYFKEKNNEKYCDSITAYKSKIDNNAVNDFDIDCGVGSIDLDIKE